MTKKNIITATCVAILFASCVPARQYQDAITARDNYYTQKKDLENRDSLMQVEMERLNETIELQNDTITRYLKNTADLQARYDDMIKANEQLREIEDKLNNRINQLLALSSSQTQSLNEELTKKEKELDEKEKELKTQEKDLETARKNFEAAQKDIAEKQKRVEELETALAAINKKLSDVTTSLEKALTGFSSSDLTVEQKDGKIYVKMSEKLLFASGSAVVDTKGKGVLKQIADALKQQQGIEIMVEGHTDNVPLKSANYPKDNWDLSVLRATAIVKILTQDYGMSSTVVEAAGRGEYMPVASNSDATGRASNRRTEIVIVPNQEDILKILQTISK
ncbi:MAG: OmpA family protein [Fimbriimonadaceae bacterium]|nr:OmpA family protein [Chitinophagales bacterium]